MTIFNPKSYIVNRCHNELCTYFSLKSFACLGRCKCRDQSPFFSLPPSPGDLCNYHHYYYYYYYYQYSYYYYYHYYYYYYYYYYYVQCLLIILSLGNCWIAVLHYFVDIVWFVYCKKNISCDNISKPKLSGADLIEEGFIQKRSQRSLLQLGGKNCFISLPR